MENEDEEVKMKLIFPESLSNYGRLNKKMQFSSYVGLEGFRYLSCFYSAQSIKLNGTEHYAINSNPITWQKF